MKEMYVEKFLQQVHRKLNEQGISNAKLRDTCIDIYEGENEIFKIDREGGMFYASDNRFRDVVDRLHEIIQPIVCEVDEYLRAMENGTELKARDFDMPYIKIAEYNEVVLAGREHSNGSFEFATWNYKNNSLYHGHYTTDYKGAREDFATRSGLVNKNLLFNKSELVEIYRCIEDTLISEMTDDYELLRELWATGELDSEEYHDGLAPLVHCFVEVKDNKIELPLVYKSCKQNVGKKVIYSLEEDSIKLIMDNVDDDKIFNYFKEEGIETIYIILDNFVELNSLAMKTLRLRNRDIVELCIDEEIFALIVK